MRTLKQKFLILKLDWRRQKLELRRQKRGFNTPASTSDILKSHTRIEEKLVEVPKMPKKTMVLFLEKFLKVDFPLYPSSAQLHSALTLPEGTSPSN